MDYQKLFHERKAFKRETFAQRMEEFGFKNMARMELFLWDEDFSAALSLIFQKSLKETS